MNVAMYVVSKTNLHAAPAWHLSQHWSGRTVHYARPWTAPTAGVYALSAPGAHKQTHHINTLN